MSVSRTIGPLHFEDLEPHRFEDLVRQLAYDFRPWSRLEAVGRSGSDEGVDILAIESTAAESDGEATETELEPAKSWVIQCKREKSISPKQLAGYVTASLTGKSDIYGFILAAACDFSKKARDSFRASIAEHPVAEAHLWGKGELEDALFLPHHDHLLFAYFGVSLQVRQRSRRAELARRLTIKRKLVKSIPLEGGAFNWVLLRDVAAEEYPFVDNVDTFREHPRWMYYECEEHSPPDHLRFLELERPGWVDWAAGAWDVPRIGYYPPGLARLHGGKDLWQEERAALEALLPAVPEANKATIKIYRVVAYDSMLSVDEIGDAFNEGPHIVVAWNPRDGLFEPGAYVQAVAEDDRRKKWLRVDQQGAFFPRSSKRGMSAG